MGRRSSKILNSWAGVGKISDYQRGRRIAAPYSSPSPMSPAASLMIYFTWVFPKVLILLIPRVFSSARKMRPEMGPGSLPANIRPPPSSRYRPPLHSDEKFVSDADNGEVTGGAALLQLLVQVVRMALL